MIAQNSIQSVLNRADIIEIVGQFLRLKKRGTNYIANCPFHNEKTPSFSVSSTKGIYKCFGCGRGGNVVSFVQEHEKLTWVEAIRWLADYYKLELEETERSPEQAQAQQTEESLRILNEFAATWFQHTMLETEEGKAIGGSYFHHRGLRDETIIKFRLGYCPEDGQSFYQHATAQGYSGELLEKSGLTKSRDGRHYDNYRGRIIFPIQNATGRILGFGARILKSNDKAPKYINTPENELYVKSKVLYGLFQARQSIGKSDECLLVEGYLDVISLNQAGIENVVASSGTSLTEDQLHAIGQLTKNLTILYDGDPAGIKAALRGMDMALSQSFSVKLALLPEGEDPDSYVQKHGRSGMLEYLQDHKQDMISFRLQIGMKEAGDDPVKKSRLVNEIAESIARINKAEDFALQQHYLKQASRLLDVDEAGMVNLVNKYIRDRIDTERRSRQRDDSREPIPAAPTEQTPVPQEETQSSTQEKQEWALIRVLLEHGDKNWLEEKTVAGFIGAKVDPELLESKLARKIYDEYFQKVKAGETDLMKYFIAHNNALVSNVVAGILQPHGGVSHNWKDNYGIETFHDDELLHYRYDTESTVEYFEVKNIILMKKEILAMLLTEKDPARVQKIQQMHQQLQKDELEILRKKGTVSMENPRFIK